LSALEIEVKIRFADAGAARSAITAAGGIETRGRHFEDNRVYDTPGSDLRDRGALLRVRETSDGGGVVTFKEKVESDLRAKVRREYEAEVRPAATFGEILQKAGFVPTYHYQKYRTVFRLDGAVIDLDETPMGCFVEIEAAASLIESVAKRLGARAEEFIVDDYRTIYHAWLADRGRPPSDMVFQDT